jgi:hypothetical protein
MCIMYDFIASVGILVRATPVLNKRFTQSKYKCVYIVVEVYIYIISCDTNEVGEEIR